MNINFLIHTSTLIKASVVIIPTITVIAEKLDFKYAQGLIYLLNSVGIISSIATAATWAVRRKDKRKDKAVCKLKDNLCDEDACEYCKHYYDELENSWKLFLITFTCIVNYALISSFLGSSF
jgi:hypothetical protein